MQKIYLKDCGIKPNTDITLALYELFSKNVEDTEFVFEEADYYFSPKEQMHFDYRLSNSDTAEYRVLGMLLKNAKNCTINGNGARLWFEGQMQPLTLDSCQNIKVNGLTINWKKPLVAEGKVVAHGEDYADVYINPEYFPHRMNNDWLEFDVGAGEWYPLIRWRLLRYEPNYRTVKRATGDDFAPKTIKEVAQDTYRITLERPVKIDNDDILILRHNSRKHAGVFSENCKNLVFEDITIHSCGGLGFLAQFCHNLTFKRINYLPDTTLGRKITCGRDDGMQITCDSGKVIITECNFFGLMDDPINVHGCCVTADEVMDNYTLRCKYRHNQAMGFKNWAKKGEKIAFIERESMELFHTAEVKSYELEQLDTFLLTFKEPLPKKILKMAEKGGMLALDNISNTTSLECTKNRFGSCRARGILVSTPKKVVIKDNYFESSGSAILIAGDSNCWFESGECHDVEIKNNIFTDKCLTSSYQFCTGVISICPEIPKPELEKPYHKNIRITNNIFDSAETPVLSAFSCKDLCFKNNRIFKSPSAERWHSSKNAINLRYCKGAEIKENKWIGKFAFENLLFADNSDQIDTDL